MVLSNDGGKGGVFRTIGVEFNNYARDQVKTPFKHPVKRTEPSTLVGNLISGNQIPADVSDTPRLGCSLLARLPVHVF